MEASVMAKSGFCGCCHRTPPQSYPSQVTQHYIVKARPRHNVPTYIHPSPCCHWRRNRVNPRLRCKSSQDSSNISNVSPDQQLDVTQRLTKTASSSLQSSLMLAYCRHKEHQLLPDASNPQASKQTTTDSVEEGSQNARMPLILDPYAGQVLSTFNPESSLEACKPCLQLAGALATRYIDETLLTAMAATNVNTINKGDYRQVVLVGDAMDTRPFRLPWPEGTLIFMIASRADHERAAGVMKAAGAHVPRGCLLRRVPADLHYEQATPESEVPSFWTALEAAGFQANKLSVWSVQGLAEQGLSHATVKHLFTDITNASAFNSLVLGELPADMTKQDAENLLAEFGLLSTVIGFDNPSVSLGLWTEDMQQELVQHCESSGTQETDGTGRMRWLFTSQQLRLSLVEMGVYEAHVAAAEETDEDWGGWNFS